MSRTAPLLALLLAAAAARAEPAAPCRAEAHLEPGRAFVGQQVLHRQVLLAPAGVIPEWTRPAQFPGFRAEALGPGATSTGAGAGPDAAAGPLVRIETVTALFPARAGRWRLPEVRLRCGDAAEQVVLGPEFEALAPPEAGRPADWTGVVGAVAIGAEAPATVVLGEAVRVHVTTRGAANVWEAAPRLSLDPPDTEIFARAPRVALHGGGPLLAVRHDAFDLVPHRAGTLRVASLRIAYFDPAAGAGGGWGAAESAPLRISVLPAATPADEAAARERPARAPAGRGHLPAGATLLAALLAGGAAAWLARRRARRGDPVRDALREADRATDPPARAAALERGLRAQLDRYALEPAALERSPEAALRCRAALERLERARWGGAAQALDLDEIRAVLARSMRT